MKLKRDDKGQVLTVDDKPVYVHDDGKELPFDAAHTLANISRLNGEAQRNRERAEAVEARLRQFEGIADPQQAREALSRVRDFELKKLVDAGEIDQVRQELGAAYERQISELRTGYDARLSDISTRHERLVGDFEREKLGNAFSHSRFVSDKLAIPADLVQARFADAFKFVDGRLVGHDAQGNRIHSRVNPGELAGFDEALESLVEKYSHRDHILRGSGAAGGGAGQGGGAGGGVLRLSRDALAALPPEAQMQAIKGGVVVVD